MADICPVCNKEINGLYSRVQQTALHTECVQHFKQDSKKPTPTAEVKKPAPKAEVKKVELQAETEFISQANQLNIKTKTTVIALSLSLALQIFILVWVFSGFSLPFNAHWIPVNFNYLESTVFHSSRLIFGFIVPLAGLLLVFLVTKKGVKRTAYYGFIPILIIYLSNAVAGLWGFLFLGYDWWENNIKLLITLGFVVLLFAGTVTPNLRALQKNKKSRYKESEELSDKEFLPTLLLCLFVGMLGIHRFYAGKIGTGILMIVTLGGLGIWVLVDFIMICIGSFRDIEGRVIKYQRVVIVSSSLGMGIAEELEKFAELKDKGVISEEEFNKKKEELLK